MTNSQLTAVGSYIVAVVAAINQYWPTLVLIPGAHIPSWLNFTVMAIGGFVPLLCRSLNPVTNGLSVADTKSVAAQTGTDEPTLGTTDTTLRP